MSNAHSKAVDPLGHIRIAVSDFEKSRDFYSKLFRQLKFFQINEKGWASPEGLGLWIIQAAHPQYAYVYEAPGLHHICFKVASSEDVHKVYHFLVTNQIPVITPPRSYPQYTPDYLAVFFSDPDGIELEVAFY